MGGDAAPTGDTVQDLGSTTLLSYTFGVIAPVILGLFAFSLPHTAPRLKGKEVSVGDVLGLKAIRLMKDPLIFAVFIVCSLLICIPLSFYALLHQLAFLGYCKIDNSDNTGVIQPASRVRVSEIFFSPFWSLSSENTEFNDSFDWDALLGSQICPSLRQRGSRCSLELHSLSLASFFVTGFCYDFFFFAGQLSPTNGLRTIFVPLPRDSSPS